MIREMNRGEPEGTHCLEVREERVSRRRRWSVRAAQWRALQLAREVFGEAVEARLGDLRPRGSFHGFLHLAVPFRDLESHRTLESRFAAMAGVDEVLREVPLVFVFDPIPEPSGSRTGTDPSRTVP